MAPTRTFCASRAIAFMGHSPFGGVGAPLLSRPELVAIARDAEPSAQTGGGRGGAIGRSRPWSVAALLLQWALARGVICIPKACTRAHLEENFATPARACLPASADSLLSAIADGIAERASSILPPHLAARPHLPRDALRIPPTPPSRTDEPDWSFLEKLDRAVSAWERGTGPPDASGTASGPASDPESMPATRQGDAGTSVERPLPHTVTAAGGAGGAAAGPTAAELKELADASFRRAEYIAAERLYTEALAALPRPPPSSPARPSDAKPAGAPCERARLLSNRSLCRERLGRADDALGDASASAAAAPGWCKAHYRRGVLLERQGRLGEAREALVVAAACDGVSSEVCGLVFADLPAARCTQPMSHAFWPCRICAGTGLTPATSAPGLGSPLPHRHQGWAGLRSPSCTSRPRRHPVLGLGARPLAARHEPRTHARDAARLGHRRSPRRWPLSSVGWSARRPCRRGIHITARRLPRRPTA